MKWLREERETIKKNTIRILILTIFIAIFILPFTVTFAESSAVLTTKELGEAVEGAFFKAGDDYLYTDFEVVVNSDIKNFLEKNPKRTWKNKVYVLPNYSSLNHKLAVDVMSIRRDGENYRCKLFIRFFDEKKNLMKEVEQEDKDRKIVKELERLGVELKEKTKKMSELKKAEYLNNYVAKMLEYDDTYSNYDAVSSFKTKTGTCSGYSDMFRILGESIGLKVGQTRSAKMDHRWNYVTIGGKKYHIDVTYNDEGNYASKDYFSTKPLHTKRAPDQEEYVPY